MGFVYVGVYYYYEDFDVRSLGFLYGFFDGRRRGFLRVVV